MSASNSVHVSHCSCCLVSEIQLIHDVALKLYDPLRCDVCVESTLLTDQRLPFLSSALLITVAQPLVVAVKATAWVLFTSACATSPHITETNVFMARMVLD
jgi:hypothetical protein